MSHHRLLKTNQYQRYLLSIHHLPLTHIHLAPNHLRWGRQLPQWKIYRLFLQERKQREEQGD